MEQEKQGIQEWFSKCGPYTSNIFGKFSGFTSNLLNQESWKRSQALQVNMMHVKVRKPLAQNKDKSQSHPVSSLHSYETLGK